MADARLVNVANSILENLADALTAEGIDVPERRYIHSGEIAHDLAAEDCASAFIVSFSNLFQGHVGVGGGSQAGNPIRCAMPTVAQFVIVLLRCVPVLGENLVAPSAERLQESAEEILTDAMTLTDNVILESLNKTLTGVSCSLNSIISVSSVGPFGGVGGTAMTINVGMV